MWVSVKRGVGVGAGAGAVAGDGIDYKTVGFFSKSVKKSVKRGVRALRAQSGIGRNYLIIIC